MNDSNPKLNTKEPSVPKTLVYLSLLFIPGFYITLFIGATLPIFVYFFLSTYIHIHSKSSTDFQILMTIIGIGSIIVLIACARVFRYLYKKEPEFYPAEYLHMSEEPNLKLFIYELCSEMKIDFPDFVILNSKPKFFSLNGNIKVLNGDITGKILAIGSPIIGNISVKEFRALLAHELAHFSGNDAKYTLLTLPIIKKANSSIAYLNEEIKKSHNLFLTIANISIYLPILFLNIYLYAFWLFNWKISILREKRADWISSSICGKEVFSSALKKMHGLSIAFKEMSKEDIIEVLTEKRMFTNYYMEFRNKFSQNDQLLINFVNQSLSDKSRIFNLHQILSKRVNSLPISNISNEERVIALSLFSNLPLHETDLSNNLTTDISKHYAREIHRRKKILGERCPHCYMITFELTKKCHICGKIIRNY